MRNEIRKCVQLERYVTKIMLGLGVPAHLGGYRYIREAILISITDMEAVNRVTKYLYPKIAEMYNATPAKVERAVRTAIEASWARGSREVMEEIFGYSSASGRKRPTNSEFIAGIADKVRLYYEENSLYHDVS